MTDMSSVIIPKSDQLNADDLISGPRTITITGVKISPGEQPVSVSFDGDGGKPYKPCKSMCRVMVALWGADANNYVGRSMTLYRDPKVKWGGLEVGGIRISHMTDIDAPKTMALTETRASRKPYTVQPLKNGTAPAGKPDAAAKYAADYIGAIEATTVADALESLVTRQTGKLDQLRKARPDLAQSVDLAIDQHRQRLGGEASEPTFDADDAAFGAAAEPEGPADGQRGEQPTLDEAKGAIDACNSFGAANRMLKSYQGQLGEEDFLALSTHANNVIAERWPA